MRGADTCFADAKPWFLRKVPFTWAPIKFAAREHRRQGSLLLNAPPSRWALCARTGGAFPLTRPVRAQSRPCLNRRSAPRPHRRILRPKRTGSACFAVAAARDLAQWFSRNQPCGIRFKPGPLRSFSSPPADDPRRNTAHSSHHNLTEQAFADAAVLMIWAVMPPLPSGRRNKSTSSRAAGCFQRLSMAEMPCRIRGKCWANLRAAWRASRAVSRSLE
ncbi:hypothetical protein Mesau_05548 [Mesorhizobium australicum WSM2073]|uniref:Uncharacterized protein n=2 Tax=Mesorhizobium TaxID=68287 RepID=L0KUW1_MESAW|nr:hypothetical protein Mesop_6081 [Mesorhizobium opportunistum WSM2075]AGB47853.1 hypothetical protein Mesau_05548 [Mesorhizobium australicum WSM2073]